MDAWGAAVQADRDLGILGIAPGALIAALGVAHAVHVVGRRAAARRRAGSWSWKAGSWSWKAGRRTGRGSDESTGPWGLILRRVVQVDARSAAVETDCHRLTEPVCSQCV